jgi:putative alpha-1,2-mannosidase
MLKINFSSGLSVLSASLREIYMGCYWNNPMLKRLLLTLQPFAAGAMAFAGPCDFTRLVNPWIGTEGSGHTTIAAAYPLGMVQAGPDTGTESWDYASGYRNGDKKLFGFLASGVARPASTHFFINRSYSSVEPSQT